MDTLHTPDKKFADSEGLKKDAEGQGKSMFKTV